MLLLGTPFLGWSQGGNQKPNLLLPGLGGSAVLRPRLLRAVHRPVVGVRPRAGEEVPGLPPELCAPDVNVTKRAPLGWGGGGGGGLRGAGGLRLQNTRAVDPSNADRDPDPPMENPDQFLKGPKNSNPFGGPKNSRDP